MISRRQDSIIQHTKDVLRECRQVKWAVVDMDTTKPSPFSTAGLYCG